MKTSITNAVQCQVKELILSKYKFTSKQEKLAVPKKHQQLREDLVCEQVEELKKENINRKKGKQEIGGQEKIHWNQFGTAN